MCLSVVSGGQGLSKNKLAQTMPSKEPRMSGLPTDFHQFDERFEGMLVLVILANRSRNSRDRASGS
tara:strand:- start:1754 stop:1951 length:198 start_codon:yes stop_codon:yes gene_type:complete